MSMDFPNSSISLEVAVGKLKNHVPELLAAKGWSITHFVKLCILADLSQDTAYRLARGETNFNSETLKEIAVIFGLSSIGKVIDIADQQ
jgi:hypothetical protein